MTETSGYPDTWQGAWDLGVTIGSALKWANLSGWVWWQISEEKMSEFVLMNNGTPGIRYQVSKHFYKFIRPGAIRIDAVSTDAEIFVIAFNDKAAKKFVSVLINTGSGSKSVSFSGDVPANLKMYQSTSSDRCVDKGSVAKGSIALPGKSFVTLVGDNYQPSVAVNRAVPHVSSAITASGMYTARVYSLNGSLVRTISSASLKTNGQLNWDFRTENGSYAARGTYRCMLTSPDGTVRAISLIVN